MFILKIQGGRNKHFKIEINTVNKIEKQGLEYVSNLSVKVGKQRSTDDPLSLCDNLDYQTKIRF